MKIFKYNILDKTIDQMKLYIERSNKDGNERGFKLCKTVGKNDISIESKCVGNYCSTDITKSKCDKEKVNVGSFHTHPLSKVSKSDDNKFDTMSIQDIFLSYRNEEEITCIGHSIGIKCYTPKKIRGCDGVTAYGLENENETKQFLDKCFKKSEINIKK